MQFSPLTMPAGNAMYMNPGIQPSLGQFQMPQLQAPTLSAYGQQPNFFQQQPSSYEVPTTASAFAAPQAPPSSSFVTYASDPTSAYGSSGLPATASCVAIPHNMNEVPEGAKGGYNPYAYNFTPMTHVPEASRPNVAAKSKKADTAASKKKKGKSKKCGCC